MEYVKDPENIDQAVYEVVNFMETRKRSVIKDNSDMRHRRPTRMVRYPDNSDSESETQENSDNDTSSERVAWAPARSNKQNVITRAQSQTTEAADKKSEPNSQLQTANTTANTKGGNEMQKLLDVMQNIEKSLQLLQDTCSANIRSPKKYASGSGKKNNVKQIPEQVSGNTANTSQYQQFSVECYRCGKPGHFSRNCHYPILTGHMQVAMQPQNQFNQPQQTANTAAKGELPGMKISSEPTPQMLN